MSTHFLCFSEGFVREPGWKDAGRQRQPAVPAGRFSHDRPLIASCGQAVGVERGPRRYVPGGLPAAAARCVPDAGPPAPDGLSDAGGLCRASGRIPRRESETSGGFPADRRCANDCFSVCGCWEMLLSSAGFVTAAAVRTVEISHPRSRVSRCSKVHICSRVTGWESIKSPASFPRRMPCSTAHATPS